MNKSFWALYKNSEEGKKAINIFCSEGKQDEEWLAGIFGVCKKYEPDVSIDQYIDNQYTFELNFELAGWSDRDISIGDYLMDFEVFPIKDNGDGILSLVYDKPSIKKDDYRKKAEFMTEMSTMLFSRIDSFYIPMLYPRRFDVFRRNCEVLGIELPEIPRTKDYSQYLLYYLDICESIEVFRSENALTPEEVCACIYFYAPIELDSENDVERELPRPTNIWLTGASKEDIRMLGERDLHFTGTWACNEKTQPGDIVVLYAVAPYSCIHSIWRAKTGGRFCPFDHFHSRTTVTDGIKVPPITLKELKEDPIFGAQKMMNNNLQGINGRELPPKAYDALLHMIERKGGDISKIPVLFENKDWDPGEIRDEKDVEEKILIPCLLQLGYIEDNWTRQLKLKAGRSEKAIPDFVFFASGEKHAENAPLVIEAKAGNLLASDLERDKAYRQARSYAKMLESGTLAICDANRIIVFKRQKNGRFDYGVPAFESHWSVIWGDSEEFSKLNKLIGAEEMKK